LIRTGQDKLIDNKGTHQTMNHPWAADQIFYHIYPLGLCGAPPRNDLHSQPVPCLEQLYAWLDHLQHLGVTALYLGPLFESSSHGYNTVDYYNVDRRLGDNSTLTDISGELHRRGMRLVLDGVFNHVGRDFWAFKDVLEHGSCSPYASWFEIDFGRPNGHGDPFSYTGWNGHHGLVKLNHANHDVHKHLFDAVSMWVEKFNIDGLRLDAADVIPEDFLSDLAGHCRGLRSDFWLLGEMVGGDYRRLANPSCLDSVTNYEVYKSLYSSHVDRNYFEIAYSLNRQFGPQGLYRDITLYNFTDNHDVDRVASSLEDPAHLYPLYCLLFSMPGTPSTYYGSEWGIEGKRTKYDDRMLRPALKIEDAGRLPHPDLAEIISRLANIRSENIALRYGDYRQLLVASEQFAFLRTHESGERIVVAVNASSEEASLELELPAADGDLEDLLNPGDVFPAHAGHVRIDPIHPSWARILRVRENS
jgi:cyclomaltodextrinase